MVKKHKQNDKTIKTVFEHLDRLLVCAAIMVGGGAVTKFHRELIPSFPLVGFVAGVIVMFGGLFLTMWALNHGWQKIGDLYESKIKSFVYGGFYYFLGLVMALALLRAGIDQWLTP